MKTSSTRDSLNIAVAGFGIAGATVAGLLARRGHRVTAFEQSDTLGPVGAGILLQPSGQLVLKRLGLLNDVISKSERIDRLFAITHRNKTLIDLAYGDLSSGACAYGVHRGCLFNVLHEYASAAGVSVRLSSRVHALVEEPAGVVLLDAVGRRVASPFDFLIVADGSASSLRTSGTSGRTFTVTYPHGAIWAVGQCNAVRNRLWQACRGTRELCGLLPMGNGRCSLFWSCRTDDWPAVRKGSFARWRDTVLDLCPQAEEIFASGVSSFEHVRFVGYRHAWMQRWRMGRSVFIGDAAHAMSPHLGQGANLALLDAWTFATCLDRHVRIAPAARAFENLRRGHVGFYAAATAVMSPFFQSRGWFKGLMRDLGLPMLPKIPFVRRRMVQIMSGMRAGWCGGNLHLE